MPMTIAARDKTLGKWCNEFNDNMEKAEYLLKFTQGSLEVTYNASVINGTPFADVQKVAQPIMVARSVISFTRALPALSELFTGRLFFQAKPDGTLGESHPWQLLALKICLFVGRVLIPFLFLHGLGVIDLGAAADVIGLVVITAFTLVCVIAFLSALTARIEEMETGGLDDTSQKELKRKNWDLAVSVGDLVSMPWDNGIVNLLGPVPGVVRGGGLMIGGGIFMARQWFADK